MGADFRIAVAVELPQHSGLAGLLDYTADAAWPPGTLVRVPLGRRDVLGVVWESIPGAAAGPHEATAASGGLQDASATAPSAEPPDAPLAASLKPVQEAWTALPPLNSAWRQLIAFTARYYQRSLGEVALAALPPALRPLTAQQLAARLKRLNARAAASAEARGHDAGDAARTPSLQPEQAAARDAVEQALAASARGEATAPLLLEGVTGSGKTEVYLRAAEAALAAGRQVLLLVPEINLTPQLQARVSERFAGRHIAALHSGLTPAQRLSHWLSAHQGQAELILGTRLAVLASLPRLGLIIVDEEHDPSYKQQDGARYSARDLAIYRAHLERVPVLLGSATPSLESWLHAEQGRYVRLRLPTRIGGGALPRLRLLDMRALPAPRGVRPVLAPALLEALRQRLARGEQSLLLLNRRGYAPVLHCGECQWKSSCPHCSAWRVFHKIDRTLRCHHCGASERVPRACPACGNPDIAPLGQGTERLQEDLAAALPGARIARIDADTTRRKGALEAQLGAVHAGEVDVLVGTQMIAKGHDFRRITLVAAINPDSALFSSDFRAPERLFALLLQAAGRAGRAAVHAGQSEMWVQSMHPEHPLYAALARHDPDAFAASQLQEREAAGLPPYAHLALLRAESRDAAQALAFLNDARALLQALPGAQSVQVYTPVPPAVARVAGVERLQLLLESPSRAALQRVLAAWQAPLHALRRTHKGVLRWAVDVDPLAI